MTAALTPEQIKPVAYQFAIRQETEDGWAITGWAYCDLHDYRALMIPKRALYDEATVKTLQSRIEALEAELAACKLDAERWSFSVGEGKCFSMRWIAIYAEWDGDGDFADAIDAAMAAGEPK